VIFIIHCLRLHARQIKPREPMAANRLSQISQFANLDAIPFQPKPDATALLVWNVQTGPGIDEHPRHTQPPSVRQGRAPIAVPVVHISTPVEQ
jgi:hypothetical protein